MKQNGIAAAKKANAGLGTIMGIQQSMGSSSSSSSSGGAYSGSSSGGGANNPRLDNPELAQQLASSTSQISEWEREMQKRYSEGQMMLSEKMWFEQNVVPKFELDSRYFDKLEVAANTVGGRTNAAHSGTLDYETQDYIYDLSERTGVDYYLILATILHESNCEPNAGQVNAAYGYMQVTNTTWNSYTDSNYIPPWANNSRGSEAAVKRHTELYNYVKEEYDVKLERTNALANIAVGVAVYQDCQGHLKNKNMSIVVQEYGEGSKINFNMMVSSSTEILYYRDILAQQKGQNPWYFNKLYTQDGKQLVPNYDAHNKTTYY